jgi:hypothetical protein
MFTRALFLAALVLLAAPSAILASVEPVSVPDTGSTIALLSMSFCGLAYLRNKLS